MCESMADIQSATAEIRRRKKIDETNDRMKLETVSIAEPLQNRQHAQNPERCQH